jgi:tRNA pseudouridine38-40 synthase
MCGGPVTLVASGRTDAGVHARGQVCNFATASTLGIDTLRKGLNSLLPSDIFIISAQEVHPDFHARYDAKSKIYTYHILNREERDPFGRHRHWHIPRQLDTAPMGECLALLEGTHDFSAFRSAGSGNRNPVRTVLCAELGRYDGDLLEIQLEADGFLRHMVRNIVGTVVGAGLGKMTPNDFREVLESGDRQRAGVKAPAQGLFLMAVRY